MTTSRDEVLDAALELLRTDGPRALTMRRLAARLGVSYQVVYSRVGDKGELGRALHDRGFASLTAELGRLGHDLPPRDLVHLVAARYLAHAVEDPVRFELMFASPLPAFPRDDDARAVALAAFERCWVAPTARLLDAEAGAHPPGTTGRLAYRLWTAVHGIVTAHLAGHDSPSGDPDAEVRAVVEVLLADPVAAGR